MNIEITDKEIRLLNLMIQSYWVENNNTHEDNHEDWILTNELVKKLSQHDVSGRSEQLVCDMCGSSKLEECGSNEYSCEECGHFPITN